MRRAKLRLIEDRVATGESWQLWEIEIPWGSDLLINFTDPITHREAGSD